MHLHERSVVLWRFANVRANRSTELLGGEKPVVTVGAEVKLRARTLDEDDRLERAALHLLLVRSQVVLGSLPVGSSREVDLLGRDLLGAPPLQGLDPRNRA